MLTEIELSKTELIKWYVKLNIFIISSIFQNKQIQWEGDDTK